jgi:hypothetical protein
MAEPKKRFLDPYTQMSTKDLIGKIEGYYADTEDAIKARGEDATSLETGVERLGEVESKYLLEKRGEHKKFKGKPKSKSLDSKDAKNEASELIYTIALEGIKNELGDKGAEVYKNNHQAIKSFLRGKNIDFYALRKDMMDNKRRFTSLKSYQQFKQAMAAGGIERLVEMNAVETELQNDTSHHEAYHTHVGGKVKGSGYELSKATPIEEVLGIHKAHLGKQLTNEYAMDNSYLKPVKKGK